MIARPNCALYLLAGKENIFLHKVEYMYKVDSMISMSRTDLCMIVNTST